jgi:hypothetical protein
MTLTHNSGIKGEFVRKTSGPYEEMTIIKTPDGREFFAPTREFK